MGSEMCIRDRNEPVRAAAPLVILPAAVLTDGLPDSWWNENGIPAGQRVAGADFDGDGFSNAHEYAAGTSPASALSHFQIVRSSRAGSQFEVTWSSVPGRTYQIQTSESLSPGAWTTQNTVQAGVGTETTFSLSVGGGPLFVRILVTAP